jgi:hypothetical protein
MGNTGGGMGNTGGMNGTGGMSMGTGGGSQPQNCDNAKTILNNNCVACHGSTPIFAHLDLVSAGVGSRLVGKDTSSGSDTGEMCMGKGKLIDAGSNPATGVLVDKITHSKPGCGSVMPMSGLLSTSDQQCLIQWATWLAAGNN